MAEDRSIIDSLGVEIVGVMSPVSICMFLVVLIVAFLSPPPSSQSYTAVSAATLIYSESPSDSTSQKFSGSALNALAFVALIAVVTFLLVVLYYYNCTGFLKAYMRFSAFFVLASMGGAILLSFLRRASVPIDSFTAAVFMFNFSAVGVLAVLSAAVPIILRQSYTVCLGVIVAAWFTRLPEWTTWAVLLALAFYDLIAVLCPHGPLKLLVDLASSRDEELPALVYEARPTPSTIVAVPLPTFAFVGETSTEIEMANHSVLDINENNEREASNQEQEMEPLVANEESSPVVGVGEERPRGIRLGLGDFVFYSVMVGRAAMYDWMTVYACYLAIIAGLGCTLILLSVYRHALPALPISIALGFMFYFLTRLLMEPFIVGASTVLVMF